MPTELQGAELRDELAQQAVVTKHQGISSVEVRGWEETL
jgi:hypothetical protein